MRYIITLAALLLTLNSAAQHYISVGNKRIEYNSIADAENKLIEIIKKRRAFPEKPFTQLVENDDRCIAYDFGKLEKAVESVTHRPFRVITSEDGMLRFYSWDISGGTMSDFSGITSYKDGSKVHSHSFISGEIDMGDYERGLSEARKIGAIACGAFDVKCVQPHSGQKVYVVSSASCGSSAMAMTVLSAYTITDGKLKECPLFNTEGELSSSVELYHDPCIAYFGDIVFEDNDIYIPETGEGKFPTRGDWETGRLRHYRFDGNRFNYSGILYPGKLHKSLCNYERNIVVLDNGTWIIRIDRMPNGTFRYASWKNKKCSEEPDLITGNGSYTESKIEKGYNSKQEKYIFKNGEYSYEISWILDYTFDILNPTDWLVEVKRAGKVLMRIREKK